MPTPSITEVMTTFPVRVDAETTVEEALRLLEDHGFHHLPVSEATKVIGIVSDAMLRAAQAAGGGSVPLHRLCFKEPLSFDVGSPLREVAHQMKLDSAAAALVTARGRLAGIVTLSDLYAVLVELMPGPPPTGPSPDVA